MKVIHRSDTLLLIEDRPWLIGVLMVGMALVFLFGGMTLFGAGEMLGGALMVIVGMGVPLLLGALLVKRVRLTFDRGTGRLARVSRSVISLTREDFALDRLIDARVGASIDSDGTTYRMELRLKDPEQTVPFTTYHTSGGGSAQMAEVVNDWLGARNDPVPPVQIGPHR